jgi:hypothetical protein
VGARLHVAPGEIRAIQKRLALADEQFQTRMKGAFEL